MAKSKKRTSRSFRDNTDNNLFDISDMNEVRQENFLQKARSAEHFSSSLSGQKIVAQCIPVDEFLPHQNTSEEETVGWDDWLQNPQTN